MAHATVLTDDAPSIRAGALRFDALGSIRRAERRRLRDACSRHIRARDGEIDLERRVLPDRDRRLAKLLSTPIEWTGRIDTDGFYQFLHRVGTPEVDPYTLWAAGVAMCSSAERFGVEREIKRVMKRGVARVETSHLQHVLQEYYHSALLDKACRTLGLRDVTIQPPNLMQQAAIRAQVHFPDPVRYPLIFIGELTGTVVLRHLRDMTKIFADEPAVADHLYELLDQILYDERLHTIACRTRIGPIGLRVAKGILPAAIKSILHEFPFFSRLGLNAKALRAEIDRGVRVSGDIDWIRPATAPKA